MTDAIEQAAAQLQHTDVQAAQGDAGKPDAATADAGAEGSTSSGSAANASANSSTDTSNPSPATTAPQTGNVLVNEAPITITNASIHDAPAVEAAAPLPRESHLMLLEHKLAAMHAKFKTGERLVIDEFEQILGHIKAVL